jgi:hypothetical protein
MENINYKLNSSTPPMSAKIRVSLPERFGGKKEWNFRNAFTIGNHKSDDVHIQNSSVSHSHVVVFYSEDKWWVLDMHSSNGTIIDGKKIFRHQLGLQTQLRLGWNGPILNLQTENTIHIPHIVNKPHDCKCLTVQANLKEDENHEYTIADENENVVEKHAVFPICKKLQIPLQEQGIYPAIITSVIGPQFKQLRKYSAVIVSVILIGMILAGYGHLQESRRRPVDQKKTKVAKIHSDNSSRNSAQNERAYSESKIDGANKDGVPHDTSKNYTVKDENNALTRENNDVIASDAVQDFIPDIYFNAAKIFSENYHWLPALEHYGNVFNINPDYPGLHQEIARMQFEIENQVVYERGVDYIEKGRCEEGIACLKNIAENSAYYIKAEEKIVYAEKKMLQAIEKQKQENAAIEQVSVTEKALSDIDGALTYYANGNIEASLKNLKGVIEKSSPVNPDLKKRAKTLKENIMYSQSLYRRGDKEYENGRHDMAFNTWMLLLKADKKLLGRKEGFFSKSVGQKMADEYSLRALKAYYDNDLPTAYRYSEMALNIHGNHVKASEVKMMLTKKSKQLYEAGYILEEYDPGKARKKWNQILGICAADSEYYKKAMIKIGTK